ncbi:hypothetical protein F5B22DRAFT_383159 [Xylaria bambusicola]|uniref:uncharacterized protein n=1 Tax=Xylaria bambusicola TaxID=326684 RepID=UPI002008E57E|nr:uncharacterized protein F5B22DRAFT_383159 [Xylaria bambusicola]KAI0508765.1 hypothetical protein F5B22DRAFT_383159 [Xylaria bambusicola]
MRNLRLPFIGRLSSSKHSSSSDINEAENSPWNLVGEANDNLFNELEKLYWIGIRQDIELVLCTLRAWQASQYQKVSLEDESDNFIHGFDTFIDQVSEASRTFADEAAKWKSQDGEVAIDGYIEGLQRCAQGMATDQRSTQVKTELRQAVGNRPSDGSLRRRTRLLLQAVAVLDIEKLVEHTPPLDDLSSCKRPTTPQLKLDTINKSGVPIFSPMRCSSCSNVIRGSMHRRTVFGEEKNHGEAEVEVVCENCYRERFVGITGFTKMYKHSILREAINPQISRQICLCDQVPHYDVSGKSLNLFPVDKEALHLKAQQPGSVECGLLRLPAIEAEAKYDGMQSLVFRKKTKSKLLTEEEKEYEEREASKAKKRQKRHLAKKVTHESHNNIVERTTETGAAVAATEAEADEDIPFFLKRHIENHPFGNVRMALRVGPLIFENGVAHTQGGALITLRESPVFHSRQCSETARSLALNEGNIRQLWWQQRPSGRPKRYKAILKQVIGSPFTGLDPEDVILENRIIDSLISASNIGFDDPGLSRQDRQTRTENLMGPIMEDLQDLIKARVSVYLKSITSRLLDPQTKLTWNLASNNCQNFCDSVMDLETFGPLFAHNHDQPKSMLYLMSFVCRPSEYSKPKIKTKLDVPRGLTEEYLLRFRYGRHDDADIIDTLQEYWYDWGAFGKHLYRYQDLFPWDCTEAFGRYPVSCGDCNLAKHVWAFPFDSWSIIALHLTRDHSHYPSDEPERAAIISDVGWMKNRLLVLAALEKLTIAATEMAKNASFRKSTTWLHTQPQPALDRLKLGGIHRAQPFSHSYDQGEGHHYFTASWAHLRFEDQVTEYELLRGGRMKLPDVEYATRLYHDHGVKTLADRYKATHIEVTPSSYANITDSGFSAGAPLAAEPVDPADINCASGCGAAECSAGPACSSGHDGGDGGGGDGGGDGCGGDGG